MKIRINELARELEIKPGKLLDALPELGIGDKKTHSSSLDDDVANAIRKHFGFEPVTTVPVYGGSDTFGSENRQPTESEPVERPPVRTYAPPPRISPPLHAGSSSPVVSEDKSASQEKAASDAIPPVLFGRPPLRPPLFGTASPITPPLQQSGTTSPVAPVATPRPATPELPPPTIAVAPVPVPPVVVRQVPRALTPSVPDAPPPSPGSPLRPSQPVVNRSQQQHTVIPARPVPTATQPGQILSGPRQPLPADLNRGPVIPGAPRPVVQQRPQGPRPPFPGQSPQRPPFTSQQSQPGGPSPQQPQRPPLAGQPQARPVVPPRPEILERLRQQQQRTAVPSNPMPGAPRPGLPPVRPAGPGQPGAFRGPLRPGQPSARPGGPGYPGAPGGMGPGGPGGMRPRPRGPHPTALRPEAATPVPTAEQQRRHQTKPQSKGHHNRPAEPEERNYKLGPRRQENSVQAVNKDITISEGLTVKELAEKMGVKGVDVIKRLLTKKIFANINQTLDVKLAEDIARDFGAVASQVSYEEETIQDIEMAEVDADREKRPPVVTIMGHVDHGKTSLLDAIRLTNVAAREAGGITQHIGAYRIEHKGQKIAFIDTPGHQAFTRMRARGAKVTDIVILVVAADDGVMPQTIEAIDHAKAAKVPIIVAINKVDKPDSQVDRIKQQLADRGLLAEDWGGDVVMVPVSAKTKFNLDLLLEMILLVAEIQNLRANFSRPGLGSVLEAHLDRGRGPVATVLVRNGMLKVGDFFICGAVFGKIRAMFDDLGAPIRTADPSQPVEVIGLESLPEVGDSLQVVTDTSKAKQIVMFRESKARDISMAQTNRVTLESLSQHFRDGEISQLNIIVKADVGGTAEVLSDTLQKLSNDKVRLRVLRAAVGAITESDVLLATTSDAIVVGFNVKPERGAQALADKEKVDIRLHSIIYNLTDEIKKAMTGMLEPVYKEVYQGRAEVRETFRITKIGTVAGCYVNEGFIKRDSQVRLLREGVVIHTGRVDALKRFKNDASEVKNGFECGISLVGYHDIRANDIMEAFVTERVAAEAFV